MFGKRVRLMLMLGLLINMVNGQTAMPVNIMSPEAANLGKYGAYNFSGYTGSADISIPLYQLKEPGITIPIALQYDGSGFIPNKSAGVTGMNWNLIAGGAITRIVKGEPDEKYNPNPAAGESFQRKQHGYIYGLRQGLTPTCTTPACIESLSFLQTNAPAGEMPMPTGLSSEYNPDLFSFNFLGHSGTFFMGHDGQIKVRSDRRYKIDITDLKPQYNMTQTLNGFPDAAAMDAGLLSAIRMIADDGTEFYFGGSVKNVEISFTYPEVSNGAINEAINVVPASGVINAWYLTRIVLPDGETVGFEYESYDTDEVLVLRSMGSSPHGNWNTKNADFMEVKLFLKEYSTSSNASFNGGPFGYTGYSGSSYAYGFRMGKSVTKLAYLKTIKTKLFTAEFTYSRKNDETHPFYAGYLAELSVNKNAYYYSKKLDRITIRDNVQLNQLTDIDAIQDPPEQVIDLSYSYEGSASAGYRTFLRGVQFNGDEYNKYTLAYNGLNTLPNALTLGIDKWGFYNGQTGNTHLVGHSGGSEPPNSEYDVDFTASQRNRMPNPGVAQVAMLESITYPTGGTTTFEFETHQFGKALKRKVHPVSGNNYVPEWEMQSGYGGGVRIKRIINTPGTTTTYHYVADYTSNQTAGSSGLLTDYGVFRFKVLIDANNWEETLYDNNLLAAVQYAEPIVTYKEVVTVVGDGTNGYTKSAFTNHETNADHYFFSNSNFNVSIPSFAHAEFEKQIRRMNNYSSRAHERGKTKKTWIYNNSHAAVKTVEYKYNEDPARFNMYTPAFELQYFYQFNQIYSSKSAWMYNAFKLYYYQDNLTQQVETDYTAAGTIVRTTDYTYKSNSNPLLIRKSADHSKEGVFKEEYVYPEDLSTGVYPAMVLQHIVSPAIEVKQYRDAVLLTTNRTLFANIASAGAIYKPVTSFETNHQVSSPAEIVKSHYAYYADGKLKDVYRPQGSRTRLLWAYRGQLPIARIFNAGVDDDVAYTSFETDEMTGWTFNLAGRTLHSECAGGVMVYSLNSTNSVSKSGLVSSKEYKLSLWKRDGAVTVNGLSPQLEYSVGNWTYAEYKFTGLSQVTISGQAWLDEVRICPVKATMETFAYQPVWGIISSSSANNDNQYFEYDKHARLTITRDRNKHILKRICYNLFGQPEDCGAPMYGNEARSGIFYRNCGTNGTGDAYSYNIPANSYFASSLSAANNLADQALNSLGQAAANQQGDCTWGNQPQTVTYTKNDCPDQGVGNAVSLTIGANTYFSSISLHDANQQALNAANAQGQSNANNSNACTWYNQQQTAMFTRTNCIQSGEGGTVPYTVGAGRFSSTTSLAHANQQAITALNVEGPGHANTAANCTWYNWAITKTFNKQCSAGYVGTPYTYTVPALRYSSTVSRDHAQQQATNDLNTNGQALANSNPQGVCQIDCNIYCLAPSQRCFNNVCVTGIQVEIYCEWDPETNKIRHWYAYQFPDGVWYDYTWYELRNYDCAVE